MSRLAEPSRAAKRAEVKPCPVCEEPIPIRLLPIHLDLELKRVEDIVKAVGSPEVLQDADDQEEGYMFILPSTIWKTELNMYI